MSGRSSDDELALTTAVGRVLRSQAQEAGVREEFATLRIAKLEQRLAAALDRLAVLEKLAESQGVVLRQIDRHGRQRLITAD